MVTLILTGSWAMAQEGPTFADVAPIFEGRCTMCHSGAGAPLGLRLDAYDDVLAGSERQPVVLPGSPAESELVKRIHGTSLPQMPLGGPPLSDVEIATIEEWIAAGAPPAPDTDGAEAQAAPGAEAPDSPRAEAQGAAENRADAQDPPAEADAPPRTPETPETPEGQEPPAAGTFDHVDSILQRHCARCHSAQGIMGAPPEGVVVTTHSALLAGGERVVVVPGEPLASELLRRVTGMSLPRMPYDGPPFLADEEIESIRTWIERGAPDAAGTVATVPVGAEVRLGGILTGRWELDGMPLSVGPETRFDDGPDVGSRVEVRGVLEPGGTVRATRIRVR